MKSERERLERQALEAAAASSACRTHGLLALPAYGGISPELVTSAFASVRRLFELPLEKKLALEYRCAANMGSNF